MRRTLLVAALLLATPVSRPLMAQPASSVAELISEVETLQQKMVGLANATPPEKFAWRPAPGVRSTGEIFLHVASDNYFMPSWVGHAIPEATGIKPGDFKSVTAYEMQQLSREQIVAKLQESFAFLKEKMATATAAEAARSVQVGGKARTVEIMWIRTVTHLHEHLGQSIAYARSNGIVPPWSK